MCYGKKTCAKSIVITTWIFATTKKVEGMLCNKKKFAKNFYDSFILIKFGDLKPSDIAIGNVEILHRNENKLLGLNT